MKRRNLIYIILIVVVLVFVAGVLFRMGNINIGGQSTSYSHSQTAKEKKQESINKKKIKKEDEKNRKAMLGKIYRYGLPKGPDWLYLVVDNKKTSIHLSQTEDIVTKLHENSQYYFAGKLPLVGKVKLNDSKGISVSENSGDATMDESTSYDKSLGLSTVLRNSIYNLSNTNAKQLSSRVFQDINSYYKAVNDHDESELPKNSTDGIKTDWQFKGRSTFGDRQITKYDVEQLYFDKDSLKSSADNPGTYITLNTPNTGNENEKTETILSINMYVKMKETGIAKNDGLVDSDYGKTKTYIQEYNVKYKLSDQNTWNFDEMSIPNDGGQSDYALDTSEGNWIIQKQ